MTSQGPLQAGEEEAAEDNEWQLAEGIPQFGDPFIQKYLDGRDALIHQEKQQRSDRLFREALTPTAFEACSIVDQIRFEEQQTLWTPEYEASLADQQGGDVFPGMMFSLARERMKKSKLWKIVSRMPKGALLHCHLEAMVDYDWLFAEALKTECLFITAPSPLHPTSGLPYVPFSFRYSEAAAPTEAKSIWSADYEPDTSIPIAEAADSFPDGGRDGFIAWLKSNFTITHDESLRHHEGADKVWSKFTSIFPLVGGLIFHESLFRRVLRRIFYQLSEDGIQYVEIRHAFLAPWLSETGNPEADFSNLFKAFDEELEAFQATEQGADFWGARIIWTPIRRFDSKLIVESMKQCIKMKLAYPHLIAGFDFVGQEDPGAPLAELTPLCFWFKKRCLESGVDIPFFFHAGETLGDGTDTDNNLFDAVLLGTRRIGHGFSLYKHPLLINMVKERRILVESCPVSNEILRLCASVMQHPLPALIARGVPCALSNDDPAIFGNGSCGVTHDFWQALQGWENLGLAGLAALAENSVRWAAFEDQPAKDWQHDIKMGAVGRGIKAARLKEWLGRWEEFCRWVVEEFGSDEAEDEEP